MTELLGAYALHALPGDELEAVESHLAGCEPCRGEAVELTETASALALLALPEPVPPADLRGRILNAAGIAPARPPAPRRLHLDPRPSRRPLVWSAAAALLAVVLAAQLVVAGARGPSRGGDESRLLAALSTGQAVIRPLRGPDAGPAPMAAVVAPGGEVFLVSSGMAPAPAGHVYEAWWTTGNGRVAAGLLDIRLSQEVRSLGPRMAGASGVAVTVEVGRRDTPSGPVVAAGALA